MRKVLETFASVHPCLICETPTEHIVHKIKYDYGTGIDIYYWAECVDCETGDEYSEEDIYPEYKKPTGNQ